MFEQKRLGDNGTSAATSKESGDRGDEMDEKDGQVAHLAIVPISTSVTRLGTRWDLCDKSGIRHRQDLRDRRPVEISLMKLWVGITDDDWFRFLAEIKPERGEFLATEWQANISSSTAWRVVPL
jgi:hypothetical protein